MIGQLKNWLRGDAPREDSNARIRILMVCTGNICRSPTAEGVLRAKLVQAGLHGQVAVNSAGTQGYHTNEAPDIRAVRAAAKRGYDIAPLKARALRPEDWGSFTWLLAMDRTHLEWLTKRAPADTAARFGLLMPLGSRFAGVQEVPDPYYGGPEGFEHVLDLLEDACDGAVARLRAGRPLVTPA